MNITLIAIDPGAIGGFAVRRPDGITDAIKRPETPKDICDWIAAAQAEAAGNSSTIKAYMEQVSGYAGGEGQPGSIMFNFGRGYGHLEGFLIALGIPFELVTAQKWQKGLSLGTRGLARAEYAPQMTSQQRVDEKRRVSNINNRLKTAWKNKLKEMAQRLNPHLHVTLATSDALLILEYARRQENLAPTQQPQKQLI